MEKSCLIIINKLSGQYSLVKEEALKAIFGKGYNTEVFYIVEDAETPVGDYSRVVVCGGDGTLNYAINRYKNADTELIYCPYGTLNETARQGMDGGDFVLKDGGLYDGKLFSYVCATGTFTPLGYSVQTDVKQHFRRLAYIISVLGQIKVWRVKAKLNADGTEREEEFSLIMVINSPNCFGLHFNKMFVPNDNKIHLLTIKSPRFNGFFGLIEMFFPFFRAFFIGFKKPYKSKKMFFGEVGNLIINSDKSYPYCVDGEKKLLPARVVVCSASLSPEVKVISKQSIKNMYEKECGNAAVKTL